ncbi:MULTISPECIES: preprotein translocase subunit YajC [Lutispora]|uniref:Preprotein translocase subunit YajC n=1 Tax=Lutispora saccharofermentans TaxID=3024236 RepID=A0ABT1NEN5_9FIRM|nr:MULTISPECIES: preprotein translocase subunit YajC [Lutispora]MCQ1529740.1 preprotein translocase subunit YajC [Lutispora saccharofermentans]MEA4963517.1 preprotein translocase subunit YajC [Lutispora sp.]HCJ56510.1 preprotein translocase subunit YajC [Clostridiaceae bacterium]
MPAWVSTILMYVAILGIFYLLLIRPQRKKDKQIQEMRSNIKEGDEILTIGGIYGKVLNVKDDAVTIEVGADKTKLKIARWAIGKKVEA